MANYHLRANAILSAILKTLQASEIKRLVNRKDNTYYIMSREDPSDKTFTVTQGINGHNKKATTSKYPMSQWDRIYKIKVNNQHYEDVSEVYEGNNNLFETDDEPKVNESNKHENIFELLKELRAASKKMNAKQLTLSMAADITPKNIAAAQAILNELSKMADDIPEENLLAFIENFNKSLVKILIAFPRKDKKWQQLVLKCTEKQLLKNGSQNVAKKISEIITREQEVLDNLYSEALATIDEYNSMRSTLASMGIKIQEADSELMSWIRKNTGLTDFKAWYIENSNTKATFQANVSSVSGEHQKVEKLFHGSPTPNWFGILCRGLRITNYVQNGRALGNGLYFGPYSTASGYTDHTGDYHSYIGLFRVRVGVKSPASAATNKMYIKSHGYDSYYAGWATVVYDENQADICALVQVS